MGPTSGHAKLESHVAITTHGQNGAIKTVPANASATNATMRAARCVPVRDMANGGAIDAPRKLCASHAARA